ncbi:MAG: hypothetical protein IJE04_05240 [Bacilli bacterium]|nr:hypothetical protein [Bacilli bacterium]
MIYIILIFSFLFEATFTNIVNVYSFLAPLFLLTSLTILYPYFKKDNFNFVILSIICGLFYDISFTGSPFINTISFGICSGFIILGYNYMNYNVVNSNFINVIVICIYRIISYLLLCIIDYVTFNETFLIEGICNSLLVNVIYGIIIFIIISLIAKIFNIKRVE